MQKQTSNHRKLWGLIEIGVLLKQDLLLIQIIHISGSGGMCSIK